MTMGEFFETPNGHKRSLTRPAAIQSRSQIGVREVYLNLNLNL